MYTTSLDGASGVLLRTCLFSWPKLAEFSLAGSPFGGSKQILIMMSAGFDTEHAVIVARQTYA